MTALGLLLSVLIGVSLGFFGGGGSILTVPLLVYVFGLPPRQAIASSLLVVAIASALAALATRARGEPATARRLGLRRSRHGGRLLGAQVAAWIDGGVLLLLFAAMMGLTALAMWRGRSGAGGCGARGPRRVACCCRASSSGASPGWSAPAAAS